MDNSKYQITKTVRFKLEPMFDDANLVVDYNKRSVDNDNANVLSAFAEVYYRLIKKFKDLVYCKSKNGVDYSVDGQTGLINWNGLLEAACQSNKTADALKFLLFFCIRNTHLWRLLRNVRFQCREVALYVLHPCRFYQVGCNSSIPPLPVS